MSIPKIIHYCWFGGGPISPESRKCIESWKKYCPDYKIIEWNDQNFDISTNRYAQQAYEAKIRGKEICLCVGLCAAGGAV